MRSKLTQIALTGFVLLIIATCFLRGGPTTMSDHWSLDDQEHFQSADAIIAAFKSHVIAIDTYQGKVSDIDYVVVVAYPYSGTRAAQVYCYLNHSYSWILHTYALIEDTRITVVQKEKTIEVIDDGNVVLSMNFPKGK